MKKIISIAAILVCAAACQRASVPAATPVVFYEINNSSQPILLGHGSPGFLMHPNYLAWYRPSFDSYLPDQAALTALAPLLAGRRMEIFMGTWCGDSRREVPRMLKLLQQAGMDSTAISLVFVNNATEAYKQSPQHEERGKNIHRVPTFILYNGQRELGRIVESPQVSLEQDMLSILRTGNYQPRYAAVAYWTTRVPNRSKPISEQALAAIAKNTHPLHYGEFNTYAYVQAAAGALTEAVNVARLNCLLFPGQASAWDTLADMLTRAGDAAGAELALQQKRNVAAGAANGK